jgi:hypothetical protein
LPPTRHGQPNFVKDHVLRGIPWHEAQALGELASKTEYVLIPGFVGELSTYWSTSILHRLLTQIGLAAWYQEPPSRVSINCALHVMGVQFHPDMNHHQTRLLTVLHTRGTSVCCLSPRHFSQDLSPYGWILIIHGWLHGVFSGAMTLYSRSSWTRG